MYETLNFHSQFRYAAYAKQLYTTYNNVRPYVLQETTP